MKNLVVNEKYNGKKLNTFLMAMFPAMASSTLYKALRKKDIRINEKRVHDNICVYTGDMIQVYIADDLLYPFLSDIEIVYEDTHILVANKPAQLEVVGENSLTSYLQSKGYSFIAPCHRIDRNTTGLVLFAKDETSLSILLDKFKNHEIEKHYLATVSGILPVKQNRLEAYLFKDAKKSTVYIAKEPQKGYRKIITSYTVLQENKQDHISVLDVCIETGRTHQIRAHLAYLGFPIIGDEKYGNYEINRKLQKHTQMLCSYRLKFCFSSESGILQYLNGKEIKI